MPEADTVNTPLLYVVLPVSDGDPMSPAIHGDGTWASTRATSAQSTQSAENSHPITRTRCEHTESIPNLILTSKVANGGGAYRLSKVAAVSASTAELDTIAAPVPAAIGRRAAS